MDQHGCAQSGTITKTVPKRGPSCRNENGSSVEPFRPDFFQSTYWFPSMSLNMTLLVMSFSINLNFSYIIFDREAREIMHLVASVRPSVCLSVRLSVCLRSHG